MNWLWHFCSLAWLDSTSRSGFLGAMVMLSTLSEMVASKGGTEFSLKCTLMPLACWGPDWHGDKEKKVEPRRRKVAYVRMAFYGHGKGKKICSCHIDYQIVGHPVHPRVRSPQYLTCDSDLEVGFEKNIWRTVNSLIDPSGHVPYMVSVQEWDGRPVPEPPKDTQDGPWFQYWPYNQITLQGEDRLRWHCTDSEQEP